MDDTAPAAQATIARSNGRFSLILGYSLLLATHLGLWIFVLLNTDYSAVLPSLDFMGMYLGGYLLLHGQGAQLYDQATQLRLHESFTAPAPPLTYILFIYPGWNILVSLATAFLPYPLAFGTWTVLNLGLAAEGGRRLVRLAAQGWRQRLPLALAVLGFQPLAYALWQGQLSIVMWFGVTMSLLALTRGRDRAAGLWLLLGLLKPQILLIPLLALLVARRWRMLQTFSAGFVAVFAASLLLLGNWLPGYVNLITGFLQADPSVREATSRMPNWRGVVFHLLGTSDGALAGSLIAALTVLTIAGVIAAYWPRRTARGPDWPVRFALSFLCGFLVDPHLYAHDTTVGLAVGFVLWRAAGGADRRLRLLRGLLIAGPFVFWLQGFARDIEPVELGACYILALLAAVAWAWPVLHPVRTPLSAQADRPLVRQIVPES